MKVSRFSPLILALSFSVASTFAQGTANNTTQKPVAEKPKNFEVDSFMKTDHVGPLALSFMLGKWHGSVDGELWEEVWAEKEDKTMIMCLRNIQDQAGVVDFEVCVIRGGRHGGTSYCKKLSPMLIEESRDPWMGGVGQDSSNSAYLDLNLKAEDSTVKDRQRLEYTKKTNDLVILKVNRNQKEKVIELRRSIIQ